MQMYSKDTTFLAFQQLPQDMSYAFFQHIACCKCWCDTSFLPLETWKLFEEHRFIIGWILFSQPEHINWTWTESITLSWTGETLLKLALFHLFLLYYTNHHVTSSLILGMLSGRDGHQYITQLLSCEQMSDNGIHTPTSSSFFSSSLLFLLHCLSDIPILPNYLLRVCFCPPYFSPSFCLCVFWYAK